MKTILIFLLGIVLSFITLAQEQKTQLEELKLPRQNLQVTQMLQLFTDSKITPRLKTMLKKTWNTPKKP